MKPFTFNKCNKPFIRQYDLKTHQNVHLAAKPYACNRDQNLNSKVAWKGIMTIVINLSRKRLTPKNPDLGISSEVDIVHATSNQKTEEIEISESPQESPDSWIVEEEAASSHFLVKKDQKQLHSCTPNAVWEKIHCFVLNMTYQFVSNLKNYIFFSCSNTPWLRKTLLNLVLSCN